LGQNGDGDSRKIGVKFMRTTRRLVVQGAAALGLAGHVAAAETVVMPFGNGGRPLARSPQKRALIRLTARPPQLETPFQVFDQGVITPNDAFFVRYHLAGDAPPPNIDPETFRLTVKGLVDQPLSLSLAELRAMPSEELVAINQCSGNGRGFFEPRVPGGQAGNGLMGNARWRGVPLKLVLDKAGVQAGAVEVRFDGVDGPLFTAMPDFAKSLPIDHARDGEVMLAYKMNGADLPILNGYPLRLVVPGYYGTYWVKHLNEITVLDKPLDNFWMASAYRVPDNDCHCVPRGAPAGKTVPIGRLDVRSFITNLHDGEKVAAGRLTLVRGIAFDGGSGVREVKLSADGGKTWTGTELGPDLGRYSFRTWRTRVQLPPGACRLKVQAVSRSGETQPSEPRWNPAGYMRNVVETVTVEAA
jgi:DMSO/TMAO reductase YedYZ molybdopterin-dependent catalytic subunit